MSQIKGNIKEINWVTTWQYSCLNRDCPICRSSIELGSTIGVSIGSCGHGFHRDCLIDWFKESNNHHKCPVCNKKWSEKKNQTIKHITSEINDYNINYNNNNNIF